ncbi:MULTISPECIES: hypothetical protein [unclassified Lacinutrix]
MKTIIKYISILTIIFSFTSCDEENNFKESNIQLVPVISLTDIAANLADNPNFNQEGLNKSFKPFAINIYKDKPLVIHYTSFGNAVAYDPINLVNNSTDLNYDITYAASDSSFSDTQDVTNDYNYTINYDRSVTEPTLGLTIDITTVTTTRSNTIDSDVAGTETITDTDENPDVTSDAVITIETSIDGSGTTTRVRTRTSTVAYRLLMEDEQVYN